MSVCTSHCLQCVFPQPRVTANSLKFNTRTLTVFVAGQSWGCHFLDITRVFDGMSCNIIIYKLEYYSLDGHTIRWVKKWLKDQVQKVEVNDSFSNWSLVTTGVAQASVLGPFLFSIFIEEWEVRVHSHFQRTPNREDLLITLEDRVAFQRDLDRLEEWANTNLRKFIKGSGKNPDILVGSKQDLKQQRALAAKNPDVSWAVLIIG